MEQTLKPYEILTIILNQLPFDDGACSMQVTALVFNALGQNNNMSRTEIIQAFTNEIMAINEQDNQAK